MFKLILVIRAFSFLVLTLHKFNLEDGFFCKMQWYDVHFLVDGVSLCGNPYRFIFVVEYKNVFFNTYCQSITELFVNVHVEYVGDLTHQY